MQKRAYALHGIPTAKPRHNAVASAQQAPGRNDSHSDRCATCGEEFFAANCNASSRQNWGVVWKTLTLGNAKVFCGGCGEYLRNFFTQEWDRRS